MQNETEVANLALSYLSANSIVSLYDDNDEKARVLKGVFEMTSKQVMRLHRWSCCIKRAQLTQLAGEQLQSTNFGYSFAYQLPEDLLRFLEINGEPYKAKSEFLDINGRQLLSNDSSALIRYIRYERDTTKWDPLMAEAIAIKLAMVASRRITKDGIGPEALNAHYQRTVANAILVDAMETGSGENRPIERILENSPLVNRGRSGGAFGIARRLGYNIDSSKPR